MSSLVERAREADTTKTRLAAQQAAASADGRVDPEWARMNPDEASAAVTRAEWEQYQKDFVPVENELLAKANDSAWVETAADNAGSAVREGSSLAAASMGDSFARRGITTTASQDASISRRRGLEDSLGVATAENTTRRSLSDMRTNLMADTLATGRSIATSGSGSLGTASGLASQRDAEGRAADAAARSGKMGAMATGAGAGFAMGGPYGAAAGATLGLLFG